MVKSSKSNSWREKKALLHCLFAIDIAFPVQVGVGTKVLDIPAYHVPMQANDGSMIRLSDLVDVSPVVLFFYPKTGSSKCTKQACTFRDVYQNCISDKAKLFGVSGDTMVKQDEFSQEHSLPYLLLADKNDRLRKGFEVKNNLLVLPGRQTIVINTAGEIVMSYNDSSEVGHVSRALEALSKLTSETE